MRFVSLCLPFMAFACATEPGALADGQAAAPGLNSGTVGLQVAPVWGAAEPGGELAFELTGLVPGAIANIYFSDAPGQWCPSGVSLCLDIAQTANSGAWTLRNINTNSGNVSRTEMIPNGIEADKDYAFQVIAYDPASGSVYKSPPRVVHIEAPEIACDGDDMYEPNNASSDAVFIGDNDIIEAANCEAAGIEWFAVELNDNDRVMFNVVPREMDGEWDIALFDAPIANDEVILDNAIAHTSSNGGPLMLAHDAPMAGTVYLAVHTTSTDGDLESARGYEIRAIVDRY
jgi:hypothetical protein